MEVHQVETGPAAGRWIRAQWDERGAQWTSSDLRPSHAFQGYRYTYARTLAGLAGEGIRTYATEQAARGEPEGEGDDASDNSVSGEQEGEACDGHTARTWDGQRWVDVPCAAEECDRCGTCCGRTRTGSTHTRSFCCSSADVPFAFKQGSGPHPEHRPLLDGREHWALPWVDAARAPR